MNGTATPRAASPTRTDTTRLPRVGDGPATTREIGFPWTQPPVTSLHLTTHARIRRHWAVTRRSPFLVHDLPLSWARACEWVGGIALGLLVLAGLAVLLRVTYPLGVFFHLVATGAIR